MKQTSMKKHLLTLLSAALVAVMMLTFVSCTGGSDKDEGTGTTAATETVTGNATEATSNATSEAPSEAPTEAPTEAATESGKQVVGEGKTVFTFVVTDGEGKETTFEVHTDETVVGKALLNAKLIEGEDGPYGLYVKKVNGIEADYDKDKTYWAFYVNGVYAEKGVDQTSIEAGATYAFKVEKGE